MCSLLFLPDYLLPRRCVTADEHAPHRTPMRRTHAQRLSGLTPLPPTTHPGHQSTHQRTSSFLRKRTSAFSRHVFQPPPPSPLRSRTRNPEEAAPVPPRFLDNALRRGGGPGGDDRVPDAAEEPKNETIRRSDRREERVTEKAEESKKIND